MLQQKKMADCPLLCLSVLPPAQSCGPPPTVKNAYVHTTGETYLHNASYVCNAGLQLAGPKTLVCQDNGTWSLPAPVCEGINVRNFEKNI